MPVGWKTPSASTLPWFAPYLFIAVGLSIENDGSDIAPMNDADGSFRLIVMLEPLFTLQLLKRLPFGAPDFGL